MTAGVETHRDKPSSLPICRFAAAHPATVSSRANQRQGYLTTPTPTCGQTMPPKAAGHIRIACCGLLAGREWCIRSNKAGVAKHSATSLATTRAPLQRRQRKGARPKPARFSGVRESAPYTFDFPGQWRPPAEDRRAGPRGLAESPFAFPSATLYNCTSDSVHNPGRDAIRLPAFHRRHAVVAKCQPAGRSSCQSPG
jgi:hypothetical protein